LPAANFRFNSDWSIAPGAIRDDGIDVDWDAGTVRFVPQASDVI
jgi:hypothetical protein